MKLLLIALLLPLPSQASQEAQESILHKEFIPTAFGIKSRTIDSKDADNVIKAIEQYKLLNPNTEITGIEIQTCTSDYELPSATVASKKVDEHVKLAEERHSMVSDKVSKKALQVQGQHKLCGPTFERKDLNDRFITKESGTIYEQKFNELLSNKEFVVQLKEDALVEDPKVLKTKYPTPFLAKFKPFQGIRVFIKGKVKKTQTSPAVEPKTQPSGKIQ